MQFVFSLQQFREADMSNIFENAARIAFSIAATAVVGLGSFAIIRLAATGFF